MIARFSKKLGINFKWLIFSGFVILISIFSFLCYYIYETYQKQIETSRWVSHTNEVLLASESLLDDLFEAESGQRGYLITGDSLFLQPYLVAIKSIDESYARLIKLVFDNPIQLENVKNLRPIIDQRMFILADNLEIENKEGFEQARTSILTLKGKILMSDIRKRIAEIQNIENNMLVSRKTDNENQISNFEWVYFTSAGFVAVMLMWLSYTIFMNAIERDKTEQVLQKSLKEVTDYKMALEDANKELESFSYSISHDLRAPLRSINGYAMALAEDHAPKIDDEGQRLLRIVMNNAKRMGQLIDDLLAFSRMGRQPLSKSLLNMDEFVKHIADELITEKNGQPIDFDLKPLGSAMADINMLRQVWINLISNAIKYSNKKERSIIEVGSLEAEAREKIFYVRDNGAGFDMAYRDKLFGVFQRLHKLKDFEGTGVGLALTKRIIDKHGGAIWAEAAIDKGATFYFTLPN